MDLKRLQHLVALADERNFSRAAERVHLSQPAFSRSVQAAEAELGLQLFDRGNLEVTCTSAGHFFIERARALLFNSRCLERDVRLYRDQLIGDLAIGVGPFPAATIVPALMIELRARYPGINSRVEVNNWQYLLAHLHAEELDFFVADTRDVPNDTSLSVTQIGQQHGHFYVRAAHPLRQKKLTPAEIAPYGLASVRLPESIKQVFRQLMGLQPGDRLPLALECDDVNLLKQVTLASDTVLACSDKAVQADVASGRLRALPLIGLPPLHTQLGIVSLKGRSHSPIAAFAIDFIRELAGKG